MPIAAFATLGCKVNQYETEAMIELLKKNGYTITDFDEFADVYIINTCTVTSFGDKKSRQMIRKAKKINKNAIVAAVGCYSQIACEEVAKIPEVDIIAGTAERKRIVELIEKFKNDGDKIKNVSNVMKIKEFEELDIEEYREKTRAFLKVQDGCNKFCSYCIIPYTRGPVRSRPLDNILNQVQRLQTEGFKEVILSGIHVASYGSDLKNTSLVDLIKEIDKLQGIERIRIGSLEPTFFNDKAINELKNIKKLCHHFHISLQSGCDETLKRMNRHYKTEEYEYIIYKLREAFFDVSITTDIITGFPGETETEFNKTYEFLEKIKLSKTHIFKYSPRKGTKAFDFEGAIPSNIKELRSNALQKLNEVNEKSFINKFIGLNMKVLYEQYVKDMSDFMEGYTDNYINVRSKANSDISGNIINTVLKENKVEYAIGEIII